jgi:hypothetical protein
MKNTVRNNATSSNLKGKPMTKTIGLHWLQQVTKHVPATDEVSIHRAQLRVKSLLCWSPNGNKLYLEMGIPHMGISESPCPFPYGDSPYGDRERSFGDL